ncbi:MAG TPA: hydroxymethylbilane synthase, partial [Desulfobacteraceae bacterium]|nr:hydroxymethylbilane synthase [Desulfobacteraceae bacterium]
PDISIIPLRGNLDTRLRKLETENMDAVVLAAAGLKRLNFENRITEYLDEDIMLPAVGQGALCIEIREDDSEIFSIVSDLDHWETRSVVAGERAFLNYLGGSCQVPVAAFGKIEQDRLTLTGLVADIDGTTLIKETLSGSAELSEQIGINIAKRLLAGGADKILEKLKENES